jgi:predicted RND superfamily exporter protein
LGNEPLENQLKAIEVFKAMLQSPLFLDNPNIKSFGDHLTRLSELDDTELPATIEVFERNLLAALPLAINDLQSGLHPGAPSYRTIPKHIKERWQSADGSLRIQVFPENRINTNYEMKRFASAVHQVVPLATGDLAVTIASGETVVSAFKQAIFTALVAIFLLLMVYLKNIRLTLYVLLPLLVAGAFTGAVTVLFDIDFNFANIIALPLLLGLGVDNGVHMVHRARSQHNTGGLLQTSTARAILFSSLTTLLSFGNLAFSPHRGTASMGWILTLGVTFIIVTTLVVLPAFLPDDEKGNKANQ